MLRGPPRSTQSRSSAASDVYKRQTHDPEGREEHKEKGGRALASEEIGSFGAKRGRGTVSYTHLRAHETVLDLVCRLLLEKKK